MYIKTIDDYLVNIHAGPSIVPYMIIELFNKGIDTDDMKAMSDYLKADKEHVIFDNAYTAEINDAIDAGLFDESDKESIEMLKEGKGIPVEEMGIIEWLGRSVAEEEHREKQINESRRQRLNRSWG